MAAVSADPQKTYALVVGVEKYTAGSHWNLDGPASDARKFVAWLRSRQVPAENIFMYLSPLDENAGTAGPEAQAATRENVYQALTTILPLKNEGTLFYLFWGGHGMITPDNKRLLFYADATEQNIQNLDLNSLLTSLRSNYFPGFEQQILFIDACANYVMDWHLYGTLPVQTFPGRDSLTTHEQFVCLAAKPGEYAKNVTEQHTGLFSQIVLEELARQGSDRWPPDMELLTTSLTERFDKLRADGMVKQTPTHFWYKNWDGTERLVGDRKVPAFPFIWNVPYPRNSYFTGREDILKKLYDALRTDKTAAITQPQAVSGLGGIGKTQSAVEYAYRYRNDYQAVLWARAETRQLLVSDFVVVAGLLNLPEKDVQDQNKAVEAVRRWLKEHRDWLLILNNADDLAMVKEFIPPVFGGHILLTTRAQAMGRLAHRIEIEQMEPEEGALFLLRRAGIIVESDVLDKASEAKRNKAKEISQEMDGLPLALDQAGAYIEETSYGLANYLDLYQKHGAALRKRRGGLVVDHPEPVATTWSLSFEKIELSNPAAAKLLRLCAFLAPDAIPEEIITKGAPDLGPVLQPVAADPFELNAAIEELHKFSLVKRDPDTKTLTIHRLVQAVLIDEMGKKEQREWIETVVQALDAVFPPDVSNVELWSRCELWLPHVFRCAEWIKRYDLRLAKAARLLLKAGYCLYELGQYQEAQRLAEQALMIAENVVGEQHELTAMALNGLAQTY